MKTLKPIRARKIIALITAIISACFGVHALAESGSILLFSVGVGGALAVMLIDYLLVDGHLPLPGHE